MLHQYQIGGQVPTAFCNFDDVRVILQNTFLRLYLRVLVQYLLQTRSISTTYVHQFYPAFFFCSQLAEVEMPNDWYGSIKPRKPNLKVLDTLGVLRHDRPHRRAILAGGSGVWIMSCIVRFHGMGQLVAGGEVHWKFGHVNEPFIVPARISLLSNRGAVENDARLTSREDEARKRVVTRL
jgi:hypothetical protein